MTIYVRVFHSDQPGAPQLSGIGAAGMLHDVVYACGTTGYGGGVLDSLSHAGGDATATRAAGLNLADGIEGMIHVVKISGSTNGWDGDYELSAPPASTQCHFAVDPALPSPATGTISLVRSPAGMSRLALASNKSVWQFKDTVRCPGYVMLDDAAANSAYVRMAETAASPIDWTSMTGLCPTVAQVGGSGAIWQKSQGSGGAKKWIVIAWDGGMYVLVRWHDSYAVYDLGYIGAAVSYKEGDAYPGLVVGHSSVPNTPGANHNALDISGTNQTGQWVQRSQSGVGQAIPFTKICQAGTSRFGAVGPAQAANPTNNKRLARGPVEIVEGSSASGNPWRGIWPLTYNPVPGIGVATFDMLTNMPNLPGRTLMAVQTGVLSSAYPIYFDIRGPANAGV